MYDNVLCMTESSANETGIKCCCFRFFSYLCVKHGKNTGIFVEFGVGER